MTASKNKFAQIAKLNQTVFRAKDLANLWQIKKPNTLYTTIKRYIQKGLFFRIYKGFYAIKPLNQINPLLLGIKALHKPAYISTETILSQAGIIQQNINCITLISSVSKKFSIGQYHYYCRRLQDKFLHQNIGIIKKDNINTATVNRAIADMLYFNSKTYFDAAKLINWHKVKKIQEQIDYPLTPKSYDLA